MNKNLEFYENNAKKISSQISENGRKSMILSVLRFFTFIAAAAALVYGLAKEYNMTLLGSALIFLSFVIICVIHDKVRTNQEYLERLYLVNSAYIARIDGDFETLSKISTTGLRRREEIEDALAEFAGDEFSDPDHAYCIDLDLFGKKSLFSLYNVSSTVFGREAFARELLGGKIRSVSELKVRQEAVAELEERAEFLLEYQTISSMGKLKNMPEALLQFASEGKKLSNAKVIWMVLQMLLWIVPVICLFVKPELTRPAAILVLAIDLISWAVNLNINAEYLKAASDMPRQAKVLYSCFEKLSSAGFENVLLAKLASGGEGGVNAALSLRSLKKALSFAALREQPLFSFVLNLVMPLDYYVSYLLGQWADKYGKYLGSETEALGEIEALMCASTVGIVTEVSHFPEFVESDSPSDNAYFKGDYICHPLLPHKTAVSNSIELDSDIGLITGSNMSGKTTLIRTCGVCTILALMGAKVPCERLRLGRMKIVSSMRIVDSLEDNISTFKAELIRISGIIKQSENNEAMLFLIDEIFRGTNSDDRTSGALTVLRKLSLPYVTGLMTTHDYAMIDKTQDEFTNIAYYHFSEQYTDTGIVFDYILAPGVSRESNAKYLMKLVGIE
ncbi:MAG: hypothetical protein K5745_06175 [Saccharofermentans sp.]|nr:hypothetical protein [Saccharofermentans sp.]